MKTVFVLIAVIAFMNCKAEIKVPAAVQDAFKKDFPGIVVKKWEKEDGNYEANFLKEHKVMSAVYSTSGKWMETETDIDIKQLPAAVITYLQQHYKDAAIKEAAFLKTPDGDRYEAEVKGVKKDILFDNNGKFLKEE